MKKVVETTNDLIRVIKESNEYKNYHTLYEEIKKSSIFFSGSSQCGVYPFRSIEGKG